MRFKKFIAAITALVLLTGLFTVAPVAQAEEVEQSAISGPMLYASSGADDWSEDLDLDELHDYLYEKMAACEQNVDISAFDIDVDDISDLLLFMQQEIPEAFHVNLNQVYYSYYKGDILSLDLRYYCDATTYQEQYAAVKAAAKEMVKGIKNLGELEKALLLHDRIAQHCAYESGTFLPMDYTLYGTLIEKTSVCQGYALTYKYLLEMVGMESEICTSQRLNHAWNIITVNGERYHVDVTWDDPTNDVLGRVNHNNFLRSTIGIFSTGHTAYDYDWTPDDTTYDNYFWQDSKTAFQLAGGEIYYIDSNDATINRYSDRTSIQSIEAYWLAGPSSAYPGCYSRLSSDGTNLIYALTDKVYKLNPETMEQEVLFEAEIPAGQYLNIYGFTLEGDSLHCILSSSPNFKSTDTIIDFFEHYELPTVSPVQIAVTIMQSLIGMNIETDTEEMDRNADGKLSIADAVYLLRGLIA